MKLKKLPQRAIAVVLGLLLILFGTFGVLAEDWYDDFSDEQPTEEQYETYEPETEPLYTDPYIEPTTEYFEPVTEDVVTEPETEAYETEPETEEYTEEQTEYVGGIVTDDPDVTEFVPPTLPKTVSQKTYSTNYTAGIISWICVIVGVIVIIAVLTSTKVSGRKNTRRRI